MKRSIACTILVVLGLGACDLSTDLQMLPLKVNASVASTETDVPTAISYRIENSGNATVWVGSCGGQPLVAVEREVNQEWINVSAGVCQAHLVMTPIPLAAGAAFEGTRTIDPVPGRYRVLAYGHRQEHDAGIIIVSNVVTIAE
jgi:hypothetical protein